MRKKGVLSIFILGVTMVAAIGCGKENYEMQTTSEIVRMEETTVLTEAVTEETGGEESATATEKEKAATTTLTYIGHASVKIVSADGIVIYVDPNKEADYSDEADIVLVTHSHNDHKPHKDVKVKEDGTTITWKEALPSPDDYQSFDIKGVHIEAVPAANSNHSKNSCVGYIISVDGFKIYHAGDTSMIDTMSELTEQEIDYAMYPIDGIYNMDAREATEVANLINAKYNIPIHELDTETTRKSDDFQPKSRLVLEYGDTIILK